MSERSKISDELRPYVDRGEEDEINRIGDLLEPHRPVPRPAFRSELRALLGRRLEREPAWRRPQRLALAVAGYIGSGVLLLAIAALGAVGSGPLG